MANITLEIPIATYEFFIGIVWGFLISTAVYFIFDYFRNKKMNSITIINVPYLGDLYRFYVDSAGAIIAVHFFPLMQTSHKVVEDDEIPHQVMLMFETKYVK